MSLKRKDEVRQRRALKPGRKEGLLVVGRTVNDQRATERKWKRRTESGILQSGGGDDRQRGHVGARHRACVSNGCGEQNVVLESKQSLRETLEERGICSHQDYCGHFWYPLLNWQ
jgi:hypothetical protein